MYFYNIDYLIFDNIHFKLLNLTIFSLSLHRRDVLKELLDNSSWCRPEFQTSEKELSQSIDLINPGTEFISFLSHFK